MRNVNASHHDSQFLYIQRKAWEIIMTRVSKKDDMACIEVFVDGEWKPVKFVKREIWEPLSVWENKIRFAIKELEAKNT